MDWNELSTNVLQNYDTAKYLYNIDECYFDETVMVDELDMYDSSDVQSVTDDYNRIGCIIKNNQVYFPAKMPFKIIAPRLKMDPVSYYIERQGVTIGIYWPDEFNVNIELNEIGKKCLALSKELHTTITNAYDIIRTVESTFGVTIIKE